MSNELGNLPGSGNRQLGPFREAVEQLGRISLPPQGQRVDIQTLSEAFTLFNETTRRLEAAHRELQKRVQQVDAELERKNRELAQANRELQEKIAELDRTRGYLNNLIESMGSGLVSLDRQGRITTMNRAAAELTGWSSAEIIDKPWDTLVPVQEQAEMKELVRSLSARRNLPLQLLSRSGQPVAVRCATAPILDEFGDPEGLILTFIDQSSVLLLEEKVRRAGRLAALGELAAGVAHELRNPLTTIRGFVQLLPEEGNDPDFRQEFSTHVLREIDRLTQLTEDLLSLARPSRVSIQPADGRQLLQEVMAFLNGKAQKASVTVQMELPEDRLMIPMDRDRIKQVLLNLTLNALDAMPKGGQLRACLFQQKMKLENDQRADPFAVFVISDTGCGIAPEHQERLFDPFFTTKDRGTGLGLAVSYRIVEEHRGFLKVESEPGAGAKFTLLLPLEKKEDRESVGSD